MFENPRRGRQAGNFTTNAPKILGLKSSSEQIFSRKLPLGAPDVQSHSWYVKVLDFAPFRGSYVKEFELSHSNLENRIIKITHAMSCTQFACEDVGLWAFHKSYVKKRLIVLLQNFLQRF